MNDKKNDELEININLDTTSIVYTDNILMTINEDGLVMDMCQRVGSTNKVRVVSRIGMSKSHAKKLLKELEKLLEQSEGHIQTGKAVHRA